MPANVAEELKPGLLLVSNFPEGTGYAWNMIGRFFKALASEASCHGFMSYIIYPGLEKKSDKMKDTKFSVSRLDYNKRSLSVLIKLLYFIRVKQIRIVYLSDQPTFSLRYLLMRLFGVKKIVVHDHTSGTRDVPVGVKRLIKSGMHMIQPATVDCTIGVSDYVVERLVNINCVPPVKVRKIYNGIDINKFKAFHHKRLHDELKIPYSSDIVFFSGRANFYKGIQVLIGAAANIIKVKNKSDVYFVCCGEGPDLDHFKRLVKQEDIDVFFAFLGKRHDVDKLLGAASVAVVPSIWQEAFGLTVVEAMSCEIPVVASRVGGIKEIIQDGVCGVLVEPDNAIELADAIIEVLENKKRADVLGKEARKRVEHYFDITNTINEIQEVFRPYFRGLSKG